MNLPLPKSIADRLSDSVLYKKYQGLPPLGQNLALVGSITFLVSLILTLVYFFVDRTIAIGSLSSILAGLATGLGAVPVLLQAHYPSDSEHHAGRSSRCHAGGDRLFADCAGNQVWQ
jgi:hypothetical protein